MLLTWVSLETTKWICLEIRTEFLTTSKLALNILLPLCTAYLNEVQLSALMIIQSNYRSTLKKLKIPVPYPAVSNTQLRFNSSFIKHSMTISLIWELATGNIYTKELPQDEYLYGLLSVAFRFCATSHIFRLM